MPTEQLVEGMRVQADEAKPEASTTSADAGVPVKQP
jgi:hypothetical protein